MFELSRRRKVIANLRFSVIAATLLALGATPLACDRRHASQSISTDQPQSAPDTKQYREFNQRFELIEANSLQLYTDGAVTTVPGSEIHEGQTLYVFWGIWCDICHDELDQLEAWARDAVDSSPHVVTVQNDGEAERRRAREELAEHGWPFPAILPTDAQLQMSNPDNLTPTTILVDANGQISRRWVGYNAEEQAEIRQLFSADNKP
jgi:thiol-disulfide isomerase/thioredoxin